MNPLTQVKQIQKMSTAEASQGVSEEASWHAKYKDSAYVFVGGVPYDLTEGDLLAVFAQYGEVVDVNLVRDKATGKSKGFAFLAYEDQRSTILAVDNLNGAKVLGRIVRVDHVSKYKKKEQEDEEEEQRKREARGVCRAFQRGDCTRGASCKFSHNEMRSANTGWGEKDESSSRWDHDKYDGRQRNDDRAHQVASSKGPKVEGNDPKRKTGRDEHRSGEHGNEDSKSYLKDKDGVETSKGSEKRVKEGSNRVPYDRKRDGNKAEDRETRDIGKQLDRYDAEGKEKGSSKHNVERKRKDDQYSKEKSSLRYEKSRDRPDMSSESDSSYDKRRKDKQSRDSGDDRSGQRHRDTYESSKRSRYEESSSYRHREEDQSHHRRDRR